MKDLGITLFMLGVACYMVADNFMDKKISQRIAVLEAIVETQGEKPCR